MLYELVRPKTRRQARFRRDMVLFIAGAALISVLNFIWREDQIEVYREEIFHLEQTLNRARDEMRRINDSLTARQDFLY